MSPVSFGTFSGISHPGWPAMMTAPHSSEHFKLAPRLPLVVQWCLPAFTFSKFAFSKGFFFLTCQAVSLLQAAMLQWLQLFTELLSKAPGNRTERLHWRFSRCFWVCCCRFTSLFFPSSHVQTNIEDGLGCCRTWLRLCHDNFLPTNCMLLQLLSANIIDSIP